MEEITHEKNSDFKPAREKRPIVKAESIGLKISVPLEISQRIQEAHSLLKERGYAGKVEDLMGILWEQVTEEWCAHRVEALTPDEYYLDATKQIPEVRQKLVDQAKKALLKVKDDLKN